MLNNAATGTTTADLVRWELSAAKAIGAPPHKRPPAHNGIGLLSDPAAFHAVTLGRLGYGYDRIQKETGLTRGKIALRLKKGGVRIRDYSRGNTDIAQLVCRRVAAAAAKLVTLELRHTAIDV